MSFEFGPSQRDVDLVLAADTESAISTDEGNFFILTGSYSIEAVTKNPHITHNDVDVNIFTANVTKALSDTRKQLKRLNATLVKQTDSRLEYERGNSLIELQFLTYTSLRQHETGIEFTMTGLNNSPVSVPTTHETLRNSGMETYEFRVKSLAFAIGTWALRISGVADSQKRSVRQSDIDHFIFLINSPYNRDEVIDAISHHPQIPDSFRGKPENVLETALTIVSQNEAQDE